MFNKTPPTQKPIVSAIIPVFDEERTIAGVIEALLASPLIGEVIVVNDGSTDSSPEIIRRFEPRIKFINLHKNRGKGFALVRGIRKAHGEIATFWDADNFNMGQRHIRSLLEPILTKKAQVVLGYRVWKKDKVAPIQNLTGQRAYYRKDLLPHLKEISRSRFGVEVYLNDVFRNQKTIRIPWKDLKTLQKYQKYSTRKAVQEYVKEGVEIAQTLARRRAINFKSDWGRIRKISRVKDLGELRKWVGEIENPQIRKILEDYVLRYLPQQKKPDSS
jgi:glycosyltransferase involved in cell wall biosynthesis